MIPVLAEGGAARLFQPGSATPGNVVDLGLGNPDINTLPVDALAIGMLTPAQREAALAYGPPMGNSALIEALQRTVTRDVRHAEYTLITNGAMEAVMLALRALHRPGSVLLAEQSTFPGLIMAARDIGLDIIPVRTSRSGIDLDDLQGQIESLQSIGQLIAGLYLMPTAANPTGVCLSAARRRAIADLVRKHDVPVIEDDAYRDVYFEGVAPEPLINLAPEQVIHVRSLSKVVCPGVRLAVVHGPRKTLDRMTALRAVGGTSPLASELLANFLERTDYDEYLAAVRQVYRVRRDRAVCRLSRYPALSFRVPEAGFFLWICVPEHTTGNRVYEAALQRAVRILPGSAFSLNEPDNQFIRISYSCAGASQLAAGIDALATVINE